jgi:glucokinase
MYFDKDPRVVLTLDAGGTNFVFSAIRGNHQIVEPVRLPSFAHDLNLSLKTIRDGFEQVRLQIETDPVALSFAFPGPADYPSGIIGDLTNLPAYRGGVALGPMLEDTFGIPVFINNDGNLFGLGEAIAGFLPRVNAMLEEADNPKRYHNLIGATFGTGFGGSIILDGEMVVGDNSAGGEIWAIRHLLEHEYGSEEGVSIRGIRAVYSEEAGIAPDKVPEPRELCEIARGQGEGERRAALATFNMLGRVAGEALANAVTLMDGLVVIGGGLSKAHDLFLPALVEEMNRPLDSRYGHTIDRMEVKAYNLENSSSRTQFLKRDVKDLRVPGSERIVQYDRSKRIGVGMSVLGTSLATSIGAYAYALQQLDRPRSE